MGRGSRRRGRENALQVLFQMDQATGVTWEPEAALTDYFANFSHAEAVRAYTEELVRGVATHRDELDHHIEASGTRWRLVRMSAVDRSLLRLGVFELLHCRDVPRAAVINEAIEIARRFGSETSPAFVNGILDEIARGLSEQEG